MDYVMLSAVILHTAMVLSVMIPSLVSIYFALNLSSPVFATVIVHAAVGALTWILGIWIVASWRLRKDLKYCLPKKTSYAGYVHSLAGFNCSWNIALLEPLRVIHIYDIKQLNMNNFRFYFIFRYF